MKVLLWANILSFSPKLIIIIILSSMFIYPVLLWHLNPSFRFSTFPVFLNEVLHCCVLGFPLALFISLCSLLLSWSTSFFLVFFLHFHFLSSLFLLCFPLSNLTFIYFVLYLFHSFFLRILQPFPPVMQILSLIHLIPGEFAKPSILK